MAADTGTLEKVGSAREYEARIRERAAIRLQAAGDAGGAQVERAAAKHLRRNAPRRAGASPGKCRIYR